MDALTMMNLIDMRVSIENSLKALSEFQPNSAAAFDEKVRKTQSLTECLDKINERIKDMQFESSDLPYSDGVQKCNTCGWHGYESELKTVQMDSKGITLVKTCPRCASHYIDNPGITLSV